MTARAISAWEPAAGVPTLERGEVHVWRIDLDRHGDLAPRLRTLLGPDELAAADRFRLPLHARRFVVARAARRCILSGYLGTGADALRFRSAPEGKPALAGGGLDFSTGRSGGLALCAVSRTGRLGIDIERARQHLEVIVQAYLSPRARRILARLPEPERWTSFCRAWTRLEATTKAGAVDLEMGLRCLEYFLVGGTVVFPAERAAGTGTRWWLQDLSPGDGYVGALATAARVRWTFREWHSDES